MSFAGREFGGGTVPAGIGHQDRRGYVSAGGERLGTMTVAGQGAIARVEAEIGYALADAPVGRFGCAYTRLGTRRQCERVSGTRREVGCERLGKTDGDDSELPRFPPDKQKPRSDGSEAMLSSPAP